MAGAAKESTIAAATDEADGLTEGRSHGRKELFLDMKGHGQTPSPNGDREGTRRPEEPPAREPRPNTGPWNMPRFRPELSGGLPQLSPFPGGARCHAHAGRGQRPGSQCTLPSRTIQFSYEGS